MNKMDITSLRPGKILIRSSNWIGDAIMTTPAVRTIRRNFPDARISILAYPWVADVFSASPDVDEVIPYHKQTERGHLIRLWQDARKLSVSHFDLAILLPNAFEAAMLTLLAGIPVRAGYSRDARRLLLTHPVRIEPEVRKLHQVHYYQGLCKGLGLTCGPDELFLTSPADKNIWAREFVSGFGPGPVIGFNPGAAYGPAKCWPVEKYGRLARRLRDELDATIVVFGTAADSKTGLAIKSFAPEQVIDLTGKTTLAEAMALIKVCDGFVTNDSGLMHVAAALNTPLVAIFGSTDPIATGPYSEQARVIQKKVDCQPCLKPHCKADFKCMADITVTDVFLEFGELMKSLERHKRLTAKAATP